MNKVKLNMNVLHQQIDGFGASGGGLGAGRMRDHLYCNDILDLAFDRETGAGFSMLRSAVGASVADVPEENGYAAQPPQTIEPADGVWNRHPKDSQIWLMQEAKKRGCESFYSVPWSPPAWMKDNNNTVHGHLRKDMYRKFAEYLAEYVTILKEEYDIDIDAIAPQNEPESAPPWDTCVYTPMELCELIRDHIGPVFKERGLKTKIMAGEPANFNFQMLAEIMKDEKALEYVDLIAGHGYWRDPPEKFEEAFQKGKRVWQTEYCDCITRYPKKDIIDGLKWGRIIHEHLVTADTSAFFYWYLAENYYHNDESLIRINTDDQTFEVTKRFWAMAQFSRYIRPGYVRVDMSLEESSGGKITVCPDPSVVLPPHNTIRHMYREAGPATYLSAYKNPNGSEVVFIAVNDTPRNVEITIDVSESNAEKFEAYRTSDEENMQKCASIKAENGYLKILLRPMSITTYRSV